MSQKQKQKNNQEETPEPRIGIDSTEKQFQVN